MTTRPRLDPDIRRRVYSAEEEIERAREEARERQARRNERIRQAKGSLAKIARDVGLSKERVRQIRRAA